MTTPPPRDPFDRCLAAVQSEGRLPTVVGTLLHDGVTVWTGAAGEWPEGADPADRQFRIGSITKTFTAVLLLQARDAGRLGLDDTLRGQVPEAPYGDRTLRALLSHSAGLPAEPAGPWWERRDGADFAALVADNTGRPPMAEQGVEFRYSNLAYGLLGEVAARVWGAPWWSLVRERILTPLGMSRTSYLPQAPHAEGYSVSHLLGTLTPEPVADTGAMAPAGQLWSTLGDLSTYARFVMDGHPAVLGLGTLEEAAVEVLPDSEYGLGFRTTPGAGGLAALVGHTGTMPGFMASFFCDRPRRRAYIGFANATTGHESLPTARAMLGLLEQPDLLDSAGVGFPAAKAPWLPARSVPEEIRELVGSWYWGERAFEIRWDRGELAMVEVRPGMAYEEYHREDRGWIGTDGTELEVVRAADGTVSHLISETYLFTRAPYDPASPVPGGVPEDAPPR